MKNIDFKNPRQEKKEVGRPYFFLIETLISLSH